MSRSDRRMEESFRGMPRMAVSAQVTGLHGGYMTENQQFHLVIVQRMDGWEGGGEVHSLLSSMSSLKKKWKNI